MNQFKKFLTRKLLVCLTLAFVPVFLSAQSVDFDLKTSPNIDFKFHSISEYQNGIIIPNALELKVDAIGTQWDLYIGATTISPGSWDVVNSYSTTGISPPPVGLLQARVYNSNNTSQTGSGFFPITDIASPVYVIGSSANDVGVNCGDPSPVGTNQPGDYTSSPGCYKFRVDLKIVPGFNYRAGKYSLRVDYILIEDL